MTSADWRVRAAAVRSVPLEAVLLLHGAVRDVRDKSKWHTDHGSLSVTGTKFIHWCQGTGGGGAIDLVMHLAQVDFRSAVAWLERNFNTGNDNDMGNAADHHLKAADSASRRVAADRIPPICGHVPPASGRSESPRDSEAQTTCWTAEPSWTAGPSTQLCLPVPDPRRLSQVRRYLTGSRRLPERLLEPLIASGKLYADQRGNAVFVMAAGAASTPVGAELRGTGSEVWRGMARGTRKDEGYFRTGMPESQTLILCESAIDAISCEALHPGCLCISTSGARPNPRWLRGLLDRGHTVHCGFDTDATGESAASAMLALHPAIHRLRPPAHDWNDALTADIHA